MLCCCCERNTAPQEGSECLLPPGREAEQGEELGAALVGYSVLKKATADFDERRHLLGRGRCCRVFKGEVYDSIAAIKVFTDDSAFMARQRLEMGDADFKAETEVRVSICWIVDVKSHPQH